MKLIAVEALTGERGLQVFSLSFMTDIDPKLVSTDVVGGDT